MTISKTIRSLPLFSALSEADKDALLKWGHTRMYAKGEYLFLHGNPVTHFYIVDHGIVKLFRENAEGEEKTIDIVKSGQTLCGSEIMDACRTHRANAMAVDEVQVLEFPVAWLKNTAKQYPEFALNLLSLLAQQVHLAQLEAEHRASMSAAQIVGCFLQRVCVLHDFDPKGFELPYSKTLMASRLGMELETFSRALARLKPEGIVVNGSHVSFTDLHQMQEYVCNRCSVSEECPTHGKLEKKAGGH